MKPSTIGLGAALYTALATTTLAESLHTFRFQATPEGSQHRIVGSIDGEVLINGLGNGDSMPFGSRGNDISIRFSCGDNFPYFPKPDAEITVTANNRPIELHTSDKAFADYLVTIGCASLYVSSGNSEKK